MACTDGAATLTWKVPDDVTNTVRSVDDEPGSKPDSYMRVRMTNDNGGDGQKPTGITATGEVEDYKVSIRIPTLQLSKSVDNTYASDEVPGLSADRWTVEGSSGGITRSGQGTTGDPQSIPQGEVSLSESSEDPQAAGYEPGQWECQETADTNGESYSSTVGESSNGQATLTVRNQDRVTCAITNKTKPGSVTWKKLDADGTTLLGGSQWTLSGPGVPTGTRVTDCVDTCASGPYEDQDPEPGRFSLTGLTWGTYSIEEAAAPAGYTPATGTFTFTQITGSSLEGTLEDADGVVDGGVVNGRFTGSVTWTKVDADNAAPLSGSTWTLTGPDVPEGTVISDCEQATCEQGPYKDQDPTPGSFKVSGLGWSDQAYALKEKDAPAGYKVDKSSHEFTIAPDGLDYSFDAAFENSKTTVPTLPLTGGLGMDIFLIGGGVLAALALVAGIVRRHRAHS